MMTLETANILILIPAYNEAPRLQAVVQASLQHLPVLVVDDGSTDDTVEVARSAGAEVLQQFPNQGKGAALRAGFRWALEREYAAVITLDADGQHDPEEISLFLDAVIGRQGDLIIGGRDFSQMPFARRWANTLGTWLFSWALGQRVLDNQSGYRLISRRLMDYALQSIEEGFECEVEMIVDCVRGGFKMDWVEIRTIYAGESSHIQPFKHTVKFLKLVVRTRQSR
ncbi:MAG: glycosyltransferase family 2 protein [Anaerolineaceae bacterium]|nr:glycosyltransferase family 2 protein [Anaerolineaceae bacterium]